ncbi:uncharacterized protein B0P05DRAFT_551606 [Gilbertella persicaria]|uniref:uncharacterized protein n=1 Tax=Gilbertella persicaria TaxID=101096 RepID=UPI0022211F78|nr:uncharacterized protein B0P05DRAFT_551606 [Gilbertella persicaria]KAI8069114.1 hypothetical protein B0P05DRAFT_551606 [Gilbertella persicaria]
MNTFSALADPNEPIEPTDIEFFTFTGLVPDAKVAVQKSSFEIEKYPATVSLLACSNQHGNFVAATNTGFLFGNTKALRKTFYNTEKGATSTLEEDKVSVSLDRPVQQVRYSANEDQILIATAGGQLLVYSVHDVQTNKEHVKPIHTYNLGKEIIDLRPNPEALPNLTAILFKDQRCQIMDTTTGQTQCDIPLDNVTAICWSPKGKQIVCGKTDGSLQHFDIQGTSKDALSIPKPLAAGHGDEQENRYVQDVLWIENHIFLVLYARPRHQEEEDYVNDGYIINRKPTTGSAGPEYIRLAEVTPIFSTEGRGNHFYMEIVRGLGREIKHLVIIANAATAELSVVGETQDGVWSTWQLPENGLANLPLSEETSMDTYPLGLALDLTADEKLPPVDPSENETGVDPVPILYYLNDEGHMGAHHCYNVELARRGGSYKSENQPSNTTTTTTITSSAPVSAFGTSAFGSAMESKSTGGSFADLLSGKAAAPPATTTAGGFGSIGGGGLPSFSNLGSVPKISSGFANASSFSTPAKPSFGATTGFGSTTTTTTTTANNKPASAFIAPQKQEATEKKLSFFGSTSTSETKPVFGSSTDTKPSLFGSTAANETKPAFGSTSTLGGFGSLAKNTVPGATSFGSPSSLGSGASFGSLAKNTVPGATTPKPFGSSSFGSSSFSFGASPSSPAAVTTTTTTTTTTTSITKATPSTVAAATITTKTTTSPSPTTSPPALAVTKATPAPATPTTTTTTAATATTTSATTKPSTTTPSTPTTKPTSEAPSKDTEKDSTSTTKPEPTAKEGMAKEYESLYIIVNQELEKLKQYAEKASVVINANTSSFGPKTKENLASEGSWCLTDCAQLGSISKELLTDAQKIEEELNQTENTLQDLVLSCKKSMDKKEDVAYLLKKDVDHHVVDIMDNRELDVEAKSNLKSLTSKADVFGGALDDLEYKFQENKRRNKIRNDHQSGELSLYSLHRAVRDIERDMICKSKEVAELEENFAHFKLNDSRRRAKRVAFTCDDLSDTEDEQEPQITEASIQHTTRYLRRYNFLDCVCEETSKRMPIETTITQ